MLTGNGLARWRRKNVTPGCPRQRRPAAGVDRRGIALPAGFPPTPQSVFLRCAMLRSLDVLHHAADDRRVVAHHGGFRGRDGRSGAREANQALACRCTRPPTCCTCCMARRPTGPASWPIQHAAVRHVCAGAGGRVPVPGRLPWQRMLLPVLAMGRCSPCSSTTTAPGSWSRAGLCCRSAWCCGRCGGLAADLGAACCCSPSAWGWRSCCSGCAGAGCRPRHAARRVDARRPPAVLQLMAAFVVVILASLGFILMTKDRADAGQPG